MYSEIKEKIDGMRERLQFSNLVQFYNSNIKNVEREDNGRMVSQNFTTVYKISTTARTEIKPELKLTMSNKESYSTVASLGANCRRLSFGPGVYLHLNKQESEAKTSCEVRPDPDIKSVRV